jgi:hypothetical protein
MDYGKHRQVAAPGERQHEWIEASCASPEQSVRDMIDDADGSRLR